MAALLAEAVEFEEVGEAGEAEESEEFEQDSAENAGSQGVNYEGIGKVIGLGMAIKDLIRNEQKGAQETEDRRIRRYSMGIVYPSESRDDLVSKGLIPSYFSKSKIRELIREMKLPYGWSLETTINQGFGNEIRSMMFKKSLKGDSEELLSRFRRERELRRAIQGSENIQKKIRLNRFLESSAANIM